MKAAFTKGQEVTFFNSWDNKGTYLYQHAVVYSCGTKQMVLTDAVSGREMGRHYRPEVGGKFGGTFPRMTEEQAKAKCLEYGAAFNVVEKEHLEARIAYAKKDQFGYWEMYVEGMQKAIDELHEPRAYCHWDHYNEHK